MKQINHIMQIFYEELVDVFHDPGVLIFILFVPLFYPALYSYVYTNEVVREVPTAAVDDCHSSMSREYLRKVDASPDVEISSYCTSMSEAKDLIQKRKVYGIVHISSTLDKDISRGDQTYIGVYCDMASMLYYKAIVLSTSKVALEMNKDIKVNRYVKGTTTRDDEVNRMPIEYDYCAMFNPQSGFAAFLIPPVLMLIIQQTLLLGIGMSMGRVRERNKGNSFPLRRPYKNAIQIVFGKMLFYFLIYIIMAVYMFTYVNKAFALPSLGDYGTFIAFVIPYILSCIFFAMVLSVFVYRREDCIMLFVFISVPLLFMSGISWPGTAIPRFWKIISYAFPSTFGMNGYVRISSMGASLNDVAFEYHSLWLQIGIYFLLACLLYKVRMAKVVHRKV